MQIDFMIKTECKQLICNKLNIYFQKQFYYSMFKFSIED